MRYLDRIYEAAERHVAEELPDSFDLVLDDWVSDERHLIVICGLRQYAHTIELQEAQAK